MNTNDILDVPTTSAPRFQLQPSFSGFIIPACLKIEMMGLLMQPCQNPPPPSTTTTQLCPPPHLLGVLLA